MLVLEMEGKHQRTWRLGSRGTKDCVRNTRRQQTVVTVWLVRGHDVWEFCSSAVEFVHLLRYCTSSLGDLVPIIVGQCYFPICRDILHLKMGPPCCQQTVGECKQGMSFYLHTTKLHLGCNRKHSCCYRTWWENRTLVGYNVIRECRCVLHFCTVILVSWS